MRGVDGNWKMRDIGMGQLGDNGNGTIRGRDMEM